MESNGDYVPAMSEEDIDRIRRWHEAAYQSIVAEAGKFAVEITLEAIFSSL